MHSQLEILNISYASEKHITYFNYLIIRIHTAYNVILAKSIILTNWVKNNKKYDIVENFIRIYYTEDKVIKVHMLYRKRGKVF